MVNTTSSQKPLAGISVLDMSRFLAGPYATQILGSLGAEVLKIEPPGGDPTRYWGTPMNAHYTTYFASCNRFKRALAIDLRDPAAHVTLDKLIRNADIVIDNYLPAAIQKFDLTYDRFKRLNPRVIHCHLLGGGAYDDNDVSFDLAAQATSGIMSITGSNDKPMRTGMPIVDIATGLFAVNGMLAQLLARLQGGKGSYFEVSMLDCAMAIQPNAMQAFLSTKRIPKRWEQAHPDLVPYQVFAATDRPIVLAIATDDQWRRFVEIFAPGTILANPKFATIQQRMHSRDKVVAEVSAIIKTRNGSEWVEEFVRHKIPASLILDYQELLSSPGVQKRQIIGQGEHGAYIRMPFEVRDEVTSPPPMLSEKIDDVLPQGSLFLRY